MEELFTLTQPNHPTNIITLANAYDEFEEAYAILQGLRGSGLHGDVMRPVYQQTLNRIERLLTVLSDDYIGYMRGERRRTRGVAIHAAQPAAPVLPSAPETPPGSPPPEARRRARGARATFRRRAHKTKAISMRELASQMPEPCSICYEGYTKANSVTTCCGHSFCKGCYSSHEAAHPDRAVDCPLCRKTNPHITEFRSRNKPKPRNTVEPAIAATTLAANSPLVDLTQV
jgi:hypothetical protein